MSGMSRANSAREKCGVPRATAAIGAPSGTVERRASAAATSSWLTAMVSRGAAVPNAAAKSSASGVMPIAWNRLVDPVEAAVAPSALSASSDIVPGNPAIAATAPPARSPTT